MTLEEYAARQAQAIQEAQSAPQTQGQLDALAARLDAEKLYSLMAETQEAIEAGAKPAALLEQVTAAMFGTSSPQAAAVKAAIDKEQHPGGVEMSIAAIKAQRKLYRQQLKQLEGQAKAITDEIEKLNDAERELMNGKALDRALLDVMTFAGQLDNPQGDLLQDLAALYEKHQGNPAAMGLLYGNIAYKAPALDLLQQQEYKALKDKIAAAINA